MATLNTSQTWPPQYLPHDKDNKYSTSNHLFPSEFPYEFGSLLDSETDEDDLISALTRQLASSTHHNNISINSKNVQNSWIVSGSPQSTLTAIGCWSTEGSPNGPSQAPSPPTTPYGGKEDSWELIQAAAGQVAAMLKMKNDWLTKSRGPAVHPLNSAPAYTSPVTKPTNTGVYLNQNFPHTPSQPQHNSVWGSEAWLSRRPVFYPSRRQIIGGGVDFCVDGGKLGRSPAWSQSTCPPLQTKSHNWNIPPRQLGIQADELRRESTGTGVFLPRRYVKPLESCINSGSIPLLQTKVAESSINKNLNNSKQSQGGNNGGSIPDYHVLLARRNELLAAQQRGGIGIRQDEVMNDEILLPQEWTY